MPIIRKPVKQLIPEGVHEAVICWVVDTGWQRNAFDKDDKKLKRNLRLSMEFPKLKLPDGRPFMYTSRPINQSLHDRATLSGMLRKLKIDTENGFDPATLVGKLIQVAVSHEKSKSGSVYAKAEPIMPLPVKGPVETYNPRGYFDFDKPDQAFLAVLPGFIQEEIENAVDPELGKPEASVLPDPNEQLPF